MTTIHTDVIARFIGGRHGVMTLARAVAEGAYDVELVACDLHRWPVAGRDAATLAGVIDADRGAYAAACVAERGEADAATADRVAAYIRGTSLAPDVAMNAAAEQETP